MRGRWRTPKLTTGIAGLVVVPDVAEDVDWTISDQTARIEDARWTWNLALPFSWQRFLCWWIARRYLIPRATERALQ